MNHNTTFHSHSHSNTTQPESSALPSQPPSRPSKTQALPYRNSQSWSTSSSDLLRSHTPAQSPPPQPHPPLPNRTPPLSAANLAGFFQQPTLASAASSSAGMFAQQQQQHAPYRQDGLQRTPSQNALTLGSFAPIPSPSPDPSEAGVRSAASTSGRSGAYATPPTSPPPGSAVHPGSDASRLHPTAPASLLPGSGYAAASTGAQPSFGAIMDHSQPGAGPQQPGVQTYNGSAGIPYYPAPNVAQLPAAAMYEASAASALSPQALSPTAVAPGGTSLSRNTTATYAGSSLLNSPPPTVVPNAGSSPPPAGFSSSTMMHDPQSSLHSRSGSHHALAAAASSGRAGAYGVDGTGAAIADGDVGKAGAAPNGMLPSTSATRVNNKHLIPSRNSAIFMAVILVEALAVTTLVVIVFAIIQSRIKIKVQYLKTVPVYLAIFVLGMVFEFIVALDAVRLKNTIQVVGVAIFNVALTVTAALEITQVRDALQQQDLQSGGIPCRPNSRRLCNSVDTLYFPTVQRFLVVVPIITGLAQIPITILVFYLFKDFGWAIYRKIGADLRIRNMFLWYQVFVVWLKFDFFFGGAFTIAYLIIVAQKDDWEYPVTIAAVPAAFVVLIVAAFAVRREVHILMWFCIAGFIAGIVYFLYKLASIFVPRTADQYTTVRLTLPFFSVFATVSLMFTLINACICLSNFGKGLREAHDSFGTFGGLWTNRRTFRGGGLRESFSGGRMLRSNSAANKLDRVGGKHSDGEVKMSMNASLDSSMGMKQRAGMMLNDDGLAMAHPVSAGFDDGSLGMAGGQHAYEMSAASAGGPGPTAPRRPRISID